jgi:type I restriction enzyme S subunit
MDLDDIKLPAGWKSERLGTAYRFTSKPRDVRYAQFERIPFVPMNLIPQGGATEPAFIEKSPAEISSGTYFEKGDLLLSKITPSFENGKQAIAANLPAPFGIATTEVIPIQRIKGTSDIRFLFYYLLKPDVRKAIAGKMEGSTGRQRVPDHVVREWEMPLPPLPEQRKIAAVLWKVQEAVATEAAIVRNARDLKKSLLRRLFTHGLRGEALKETEIGPLPESWDVVPFEQVLTLGQYGLSVRGQAAGQYPILRMNCQLNGRIHFDDVQFVDLDETTFRAFALEDGDILFNRTNSIDLVGRTAIFHSTRPAVFASYLIRLRLDNSQMSPDFVNYYMGMESTQQALKLLATRAVSQSNISASKLKTFHVPKPGKPEQDEIAGILQTVDEKIAVHEAKQRGLQDLFKTLLHQLMTAQVRVNRLELDTTGVEI